jgi:hypothetical protein
MLWSEVKRWAKDKGYETIKDKEDNQYYWAKIGSTDVNSSGVCSSVSRLAKAIYNHITDNRWTDHQRIHYENITIKISEPS